MSPGASYAGYAHTKGLRRSSDPRPDATQAYDHYLRTFEAAQWFRRPAMFSLRTPETGQIFRACEHERYRELGNRRRVHPPRVREYDVPLQEAGHKEVLNASASGMH